MEIESSFARSSSTISSQGLKEYMVKRKTLDLMAVESKNGSQIDASDNMRQTNSNFIADLLSAHTKPDDLDFKLIQGLIG